MAEEIKQETKTEEQPEKKTDNLKEDTAVQKTSESKENKKVIDNKIEDKPKKTEAKVNGKSVPISTKHAIAICNMIRNKRIDEAISLLELAEKKKIPVPMRGEIPHKKGIMSGRYPVNALGHMIKLLKSLKSNALVNELELEKFIIFCKANVASRPYRRFGKGKFKRTHVELRLVKNIKKAKKKSKKLGDNK